MQMNRDIKIYSENYASGDLEFENIQVKFRRKKVLDVLSAYNPKNILEIGCGYDSIANYYRDFDKFTIVEPSYEFASGAVKDSSSVILYVDFLENKLEELRTEKFDFIILSSLLHEVVNPAEFLKLISFLCSKDTVVHINVPNSRSFHLLWAHSAGLIQNLDKLTTTANTLQQNTTFTIDKLCDLAQSVGLYILEKGSYFVKPFDHKKMKLLTTNNVIDQQLLNGLYHLTKHFPEAGSEIFINCRLK